MLYIYKIGILVSSSDTKWHLLYTPPLNNAGKKSLLRIVPNIGVKAIHYVMEVALKALNNFEHGYCGLEGLQHTSNCRVENLQVAVPELAILHVFLCVYRRTTKKVSKVVIKISKTLTF